MQSDGLVPIAFADQDGWPAMGTFDYLNMRTNGFDFHMSLMAEEEAWDSQPVKDVFSTWAELLPFHQEAALGRTWQEAAQSLVNKEAGMYLVITVIESLRAFDIVYVINKGTNGLELLSIPDHQQHHR